LAETEVEEDYSLVSRYPGISGSGELMVLAGGSTESVLAAVEYVTQPNYAAELCEKLATGCRELPSAYEVVIKARFKSQTPVEISYVTHRALSPACKM
jgi:hypothetical protein